MTKQDHMPSSDPAPAIAGDGAPGVTAEMVEAGVLALDELSGSFSASGIVEAVYKAMRALEMP